MRFQNSLVLSRSIMAALGTRSFFYYRQRMPDTGPILLISNHRSILDAPLLMDVANRPVRFACHHYMSQVPIMRDIVTQMGCLPLDESGQQQRRFFQQAVRLLQSREAVGIFPEGAQPMVQPNPPEKVGEFHRGFAHLALRVPIQRLAIVPIAIASVDETIDSVVPLRVLSWFDPTEPLFKQGGWHPMVTYRRVNVLVGKPFWVEDKHRQQYQGKQAKTMVSDLQGYCHQEIEELLKYGCT